MKQKSKSRKRKFTTPTPKEKRFIWMLIAKATVDEATYFAPHTLKGLGRKRYDRGNF